MRLVAATLAVLLAALTMQPVGADEAEAVTGKATVLDSDTLSVAGQIYRLSGVDGIEYHQFCFIDGQPWACGTAAVRSLQALVDPVAVTCTPTGEPAGVVVPAACSVGGLDVAEILVSDGWALARDAGRYADIEAGARAARKGAWQGVFVEPWVYRDDLAAIEGRFLAEAPEALRRAAEQVLVEGDSGIDVLEGFEIVEIPPSGSTTQRRERLAGLAPGFIEDAIPERGVFEWKTVAQHAQAWQDAAEAAIQANVTAAVWTALLERPGVDVKVQDGQGYYAAMTMHAAPWLAQGRQPVLLVASPLVPSWMVHWLDDEPPDGAQVTRRSRITSSTYLATIDGIDIHVAPVPGTASALLPDDLLAEVAYARDGDGSMLDIRGDGAPDADGLTVDFAMRLTWREDPVVWLQFPRAEAAVLYER